LGAPGVKTDALQRSQLEIWFETVRNMQSITVSAYLQIVLLTGGRPGEILGMKWTDINTKWKSIIIRDKDQGDRTIPLTPYVAHLLSALPRRNKWVFAGPRVEVITSANELHNQACKVAGLPHITLHGLRRSFKSLTEWLEIPVGIVAQIMGHKPSATAEKHYTVRPLELLALHHVHIEAWMLEQAGIKFDAKAEPGTLRVVNG
jgi:integrase